MSNESQSNPKLPKKTDTEHVYKTPHKSPRLKERSEAGIQTSPLHRSPSLRAIINSNKPVSEQTRKDHAKLTKKILYSSQNRNKLILPTGGQPLVFDKIRIP